MVTTDIKYLKHRNIDYMKWDEAIANSHNSLIYAYSWYLDMVSPNWEALIIGDYEYVMPLTVRQKYGIKFIVQHPYSQQLGIFSEKAINEDIVRLFIKKIPYFSYDIHLNEKNKISEAQLLANYTIDLSPKYEDIVSQYSKNHIGNLRTARNKKLIVKNISNDIFLNFFLNIEKRNYVLPKNNFVIKLINAAALHNSVINSGAYTPEGELIGVLCVLKTENRLIIFMSCLNAIGRKLSAFYLLIDELICTYSGKNYVFDFEGSQIDSIAYFNKGFGATYTPYYRIKKHSIASAVKKIRKIKNKLSV